MEFVVRDAGAGDFAAVADLFVRVYVGEGFTPSEVEPSLRDVRQRATSAHLVVAAEGPVLVGAAFLALEGPLRQVARPDEAEVRMLCVEPSHRRLGIAEALMQACLDKAVAAGRRGIALSTQPSMLAAHRLYRKLGYERSQARDWKTENGTSMLAFALYPAPSAAPDR